MATKGKSTSSRSKSSKSASSSGKSKTKGRDKVAKVMHEFKHGELKSGKGGKVKNPKQAIAIGLSEARKSGAHIPKKGSSKKKSK
ncbi:MAG TPA: DUF6496 domain-containing protein [Bryobacteraceae bacterium]|nr:DUF6496 domain-containing protein [Bryobacteraceae bacterium]